MSRDHRKLRVFQEADTLVLAVYELTARLPEEERFGLQAQLRRACVSVPTNIVEGSGRPGAAEYCRFLAVAHGSARECAYLIRLCARLGFATPAESEDLSERYDHVSAQLLAASHALSRMP